jgi:hypothetical protein
VNAAALLVDPEAVGVRLDLSGGDLRYQTRAGVSIAPYRERIAARKPAVLAELLKACIIAAATGAPERFDRAACDRLCEQWAALD